MVVPSKKCQCVRVQIRNYAVKVKVQVWKRDSASGRSGNEVRNEAKQTKMTEETASRHTIAQCEFTITSVIGRCMYKSVWRLLYGFIRVFFCFCFFDNSSGHARPESAHEWVEDCVRLAYTWCESGTEESPAQRNWKKLPWWWQTLQDRGARSLAREHPISYLGSCCWSFVSNGSTYSCRQHTKEVHHFCYYH